MHPFGEHLHWGERLYFNFYDRGKDLCGFMSIGLKHNRSIKEMFCYFMMPDGSVVGLEDSVPLDNATFGARGLRFEMLEPERQWRVTFLGGMERTTGRKAKKSHVELELLFKGLNDAFDYRACAPTHDGGLPGSVETEHLEQVGRLTGRLSTGLDEFEIDALGVRHYSRGVNDWNAPKNWTRLSSQFSESHALCLTRLSTVDGTVDAGYVFLDGRNTPVVRAELNINRDFGKKPMSFDMTLHDGEGNTHKVFGSIVKNVDVHFKSPDGSSMAIMNEILTRCTIAGSNGYGVAEFLYGGD